jgi:hypothetical protein
MRTGIILILIGVIFLLSKLNLLGNINILMIVGGGFLAAYILSNRPIGFLIPGLIVSSIGLFAYLSDIKVIPDNSGQIFLLFLAAAFWLIMLIHTMWTKNADWGERFWPIFPAGALTVIGFLLLGETYHNIFILKQISDLWPVVLILIGILVLIPKHPKHSGGDIENPNTGINSKDRQEPR